MFSKARLAKDDCGVPFWKIAADGAVWRVFLFSLEMLAVNCCAFFSACSREITRVIRSFFDAFLWKRFKMRASALGEWKTSAYWIVF